MHLRRDALLVASEIAVFVRNLANEIGGSQRGTVGRIEAAPNLVNVVAERAVMTVDLRNMDESVLRLAEDKLVSSLLLLHGLHPVPAQTRVQEALHRVERKLNGHRLLVCEISDHIARIQVDSNGGPPASSSLAAAIERAIAECAPDVTGVEIEGLAQPAASLVQIAPAASR